MPDLHIPIRNGPHRIAAIALYRALLTQCRAAPFDRVQQDELQNIVRNRFKQARHSRSTRLLNISFQAGYEGIDQLDAAVAGDDVSRQYIGEMLERAPAKIKLPPALPQSTTKVQKAAEPVEDNEQVSLPKISLFDRPIPLEKLSGKRHIPVLFNANHIPVLRVKKPQPASLSRFLRQRIEQRQNRHDRRWKLYSENELAAREDEWDDLVGATDVIPKTRTLSEAMNARPTQRQEPKWTQAVEEAIKEVQGQLEEEREKNRIMAEKMQAVVDRETEIFEKERADRQRARRKEYRQRRQQRKDDEQQTLGEDNGLSESLDRTRLILRDHEDLEKFTSSEVHVTRPITLRVS